MRKLLISILLLLVCLAQLACAKNEEKAPAPAAAVPKEQRLTADGFRADLMGIDRYVFAPGDMDADRRDMLAGMLDGLATRLSSPSAPPFVIAGANQISSLANRVRSIPAGPVPDELRNQWIAIRGNVFTPRDWFATTAEHVVPLEAGELAAGTAPEDLAAAPGRFDLPGKWRVAMVLAEGAPVPDPELEGALWDFHPEGLTIEGGRLEGEYTLIDYIDSKGKALRFQSETPGAAVPNGWMKYGFTEEGRLRITFYEGFEERPESFVPRADTAVGASPSARGDAPATATLATPPAGAKAPPQQGATAVREQIELILEPVA